MRLVIPPGVFRPISDTWLLADALDRERLAAGARVLDLCSGSGRWPSAPPWAARAR